MNGEELLNVFLEWIEKERPERFFPLKYVYDSTEMIMWERSKYVPDYTWKITVAKECCYGAYDALMFRKCDGVTREIIPIEVKADTDILDDRLRAQLWVHIKNYGKSMLILGKEQAYKIKKRKIHKMLPTEIWNYTGDGFKQLTEPIAKFHNHGCATVSQRALEKAFGIHEPKILRKLQRKAHYIRAVLAALEENQYRYNNEEKFNNREAELARELFGVPINSELCEPSSELDVSDVLSTGFSDKTLQQKLSVGGNKTQ